MKRCCASEVIAVEFDLKTKTCTRCKIFQTTALQRKKWNTSDTNPVLWHKNHRNRANPRSNRVTAGLSLRATARLAVESICKFTTCKKSTCLVT